MEIENPKVIAVLVGALTSCVYVLGEIIKAVVFSKRRQSESEEFRCKLADQTSAMYDKLQCQFRVEDHGRLSETVLMGKTNEMLLKEVTFDQGKILSSIERIIDKFEDVARELRAETNMMRTAMMSKAIKREQED